MKQLLIRLTGEIQSSNFNEWKKDLIVQIQSINTELASDNDFAVATQHVKLFKAAEKSLKIAKQSAIEQASDIQKLFAAIDEVSEEARQTRLLLERQIRARKIEIKEEIIENGLQNITNFIDQQNEDFKNINHSIFLDRSRFKLAIKGKAGVKGVQNAIDNLCRKIKTEILQKEKDVANNGLAIDSLPARYKILFQDRDSLISTTKQELDSIIDKRIYCYNKEIGNAESEKEITGKGKLEDTDRNIDENFYNEKGQNKEKFRITIDIFAPKDSATEIVRSLQGFYIDNKSILNILLEKLSPGEVENSEDFVSTSVLSRLMGMDRDAVFSILKNRGYLTKTDTQWQLTQKGMEVGGKYELVSGGSAHFPVWPKNIANTGIFEKNMKRFVVLAKSVKHGQYCVAGREIKQQNAGLTVGQWIRPVSDHDEGAVNSLEIVIESGGLPQFLDIVEIEVKGNAHNQTQPENWLFEKKKWKRTGRVKVSSIFSHFVENPPNLWESAYSQPDRIDTNEYITNGYDSSLCIIKPDTFVMEISTVYNDFEGKEQKKRRGKFNYNGVNYDLAITDPEIDNKYFRPFPRIDDGIKRIPMDTAKCLLCISLASQFNGYHYKLIAKVIENE